jgi:hypothetical protein
VNGRHRPLGLSPAGRGSSRFPGPTSRAPRS